MSEKKEALRDQTYKQELRLPEPCNHPDERMQMTIKHPSLRLTEKKEKQK